MYLKPLQKKQKYWLRNTPTPVGHCKLIRGEGEKDDNIDRESGLSLVCFGVLNEAEICLWKKRWNDVQIKDETSGYHLIKCPGSIIESALARLYSHVQCTFIDLR